MGRLSKKIECICKICNKIFYSIPSVLKLGTVKYCSNQCKFIGNIYKINTKQIIQNFWNNVDIKSENECWEWKKYKNRQGYGYFSYKNNIKKSHRLAYFLTYSEQDTEENRKLCVLHTCDNPSCCNPKHLWLGTRTENNQDKIDKNRHLKGENSSKAKLTEEQVKEILLLKNILQIKTVAEIYNISVSTVGDLFHNRSWKHVKRNNL